MALRLTGNRELANCSRVLPDEPWQDLGFSKRPRSGAYFQRFRPRWKVDLEKRILQEMLVVFTATYVVADRISSSNIPNVISAYLEKSDIVKALGYVSRDEGVQHLTRSIAKYRDSPIREWHTLILERVNPTLYPTSNCPHDYCSDVSVLLRTRGEWF
jgi:hypothetical protein